MAVSEIANLYDSDKLPDDTEYYTEYNQKMMQQSNHIWI